MKKGKISNILRSLRVLYFFDLLHFLFQKQKFRKVNRQFLSDNPGIALPPDYVMYESFQLNYKNYYSNSLSSAKWYFELISKHKILENANILDWGCGPGRIIRHLPSLTGEGCNFYATDYNKNTIDWCNKNLPGINFNENSLEAMLPYKDNFFDVIYGISVLTHLSEVKHFEWRDELFRILKPGGIILVTTQGFNFLTKMTDSEKQAFNNGQLVVRGKVKEGHRIYSAFQPKDFMYKLFQAGEVLEHIEIIPEKGKGIPQDAWIVRKM